MNFRMLTMCTAGLLAFRFTAVGSAGTAPQSQAASAPAPAPPPLAGIIIEPLPPPPVMITLHNVNTDDEATFPIGQDGQVDEATAPALMHFFRCRRTQREKPIATGTLALLASVAQHWPGRVIDVVSGFRAPPFGAPHSKHFIGHAIDLRVEGVKTSTLRDVLWREHHEVGVGHYTDDNFVHMDWRPGEADRAWSSNNEEARPNYSPRWAWTARHPSRRRAAPQS